jgi:diguanylate cyclase (GGDEF)-like protein
LTQIFNRGYGDTTLTNEINRAVRYGHSLSLIIFDLDHFKFINDTYGHLAGDRVLQEVAKTINAVKRSSDIFFRYGGEEFGVVLPNAEILGAEKAAEKIRAAVEALQVEGIQARITISGGVTSFQNNDTRESFIGRADSALYWVKENGRNQIKTAEQKAA